MIDVIKEAPEKEAWQCGWCNCRSFARIDQQIADGSFAPGPHVRCISCKTEWLFPLATAAISAMPLAENARLRAAIQIAINALNNPDHMGGVPTNMIAHNLRAAFAGDKS